jgi:hypothetical protein
MQNLLTLGGLAFAFCLPPYALAAVMPSWRWLFGCTLIVGGALGTVWIQDHLAHQSPDFKEGMGYAIGWGFFFLLTIGFAAGVLVGVVRLAAEAHDWSLGGAVTFNAIGFVVLLLGVLAPVAWDDWRRRPPSEACVNSTFDLTIAGAHLDVPSLRFLNVYLGRSVVRDVYYLSLDPSLRAFCSKTQNGKHPIRAGNLGFSLDSMHDIRKMSCAAAPRVSQTEVCAGLTTAYKSHYQLNVPIKAYVFAPDEVKTGEFGATASTYEESLNFRPRVAREQFFRSSQTSPEGKPLTFVCHEDSDGYYCRASYSWFSGAHLHYEFKSAKDTIIEKGLKVDAATRGFFSALLTQP